MVFCYYQWMITPRKRAFVDEYLLSLNGAQAAIKAGYSAKVARSLAARLLTDADVRAMIEEKTRKRELEAEVDATWLLNDLSAQAKADINDLYTENGDLRPISEWPMVWRTGLVADVQTIQALDGDTPARISRIKLADRVKIRELLGKHVTIQAWIDNKALTGKGGGPVVIEIDRSIL